MILRFYLDQEDKARECWLMDIKENTEFLNSFFAILFFAKNNDLWAKRGRINGKKETKA